MYNLGYFNFWAKRAVFSTGVIYIVLIISDLEMDFGGKY